VAEFKYDDRYFGIADQFYQETSVVIVVVS